MDENLGVFHHPCGRREVVVGRWGHQLAHPSDCPECKELSRILSDLSTRQISLGVDIGELDSLYG